MTAPVARPILFSAPMVRALLDGRKTQTRRLVKDPVFFQNCVPHVPVGVHGSHPWKCPYGVPGDLLWVRESWTDFEDTEPTDNPKRVRRVTKAMYAADFEGFKKPDRDFNWRPSIFMPRWASRLTLEITNVRVERLHDISEEDALAEGVTRIRDACHVIKGFDYDEVGLCHSSPITPYYKLWEHLNGAGSWDANPWVVALTFKVHTANVDTVLAQRQALEPAA